MRPASGRFRLRVQSGCDGEKGIRTLPMVGAAFPEVSAWGLSRRRVCGCAGWHGGNLARPDNRDRLEFLHQIRARQ